MKIQDFAIDIKVLAGYIGTMLAIQFSEADAFLKFCLTAIVIGYTSHKWYIMYQNHKKNKKSNKDEKED